MIKIYAYYNYGGYKDFYLGNQSDTEENKYYLPLLRVHEESLQSNPENENLRQQIEHQRQLPQIVQLSDDTPTYNYPSEAKILMSHAGYKVIYKQTSPSDAVIAIRDIRGHQDCYGRQTPFNVMFVGDDPSDLNTLDLLAEYIRTNLRTFEDRLGCIFTNDPVENGLKCNLKSILDIINAAIQNGTPLPVLPNVYKKVRLLIIASGNDFPYAKQEQMIYRSDLNLCCNFDGHFLYRTEPQSSEYNNPEKENTQQPRHEPSFRQQARSACQAFLNTNKRNDFDEVWNYIKKLEERIAVLEQEINHLNNKS